MTGGAPAGPAERDGAGSVEVVGTAHVSSDSVTEVRDTVADRQPDVVAVELDEGRFRQLKGEAPEDLEPADLLGGNTVFQFLAYWMLSYVQSRLGDRFDIQPGADMLAAVESAEEHGIDVALVDREIQTTIQRFWARLSVAEKLKLIAGLALGVTDPLYVGLALGMLAGGVLGAGFGLGIAPLVGLGGPFTLWLGQSALAGVGGFVVGALAGVLVAGTALPPTELPMVGRVDQLEYSVAGGALGGLMVAALAASGTPVPGIGALELSGLGAGVLRATVGGGLGAAGGLAVGAVLGGVLSAVLDDPAAVDEDLTEMDLTDADVVTAMLEELRRFSPGGAEALIDERDAYIAQELVALRDQGLHVVAVVGAGHEAGITEFLDHPDRLPTRESLVGAESGGRVPWFKLVGWAITLGFLGFFALLALGISDDRLLVELFAAWFLVNGAIAGGLARLAGARWQSATVGGLVAWMTSINPLLAPGWFVGYVELLYTKVNVADIADMNEILDDHESPLRDVVARLLDVPLFRLVMVVAATNVGSMVASVLFVVGVLPWLDAAMVQEGCTARSTLFGVDVSAVECLSDSMLAAARDGAEVVRGVVT
jgi:pheromone shutdown protein TraB